MKEKVYEEEDIENKSNAGEINRNNYAFSQ